VVDTDGASNVSFTGVSPGSYYIVIRHRNHLAIMSASAVALSGSSSLYDFTDWAGGQKAFGTASAMKNLGGGVYGMYAGDANASGDITILDRAVWRTQNGTVGYLSADFNLSGDVTILDRALWRVNNSISTQVP